MKGVQVSCPVCVSKKNELIRSYNAVSPIFDGVNLYRCQNCELVYAFPLPEPVDIEKYNNDYFSSAHGVSVDSFFAKSFFEGIAQIRIKYISDKSQLNFANVSSVLEVGPGRGYLAKELLKLNAKIEYDAIETDSSCHQQLESIGVRLIKNNQLRVYDLIIISHVLEHTQFPYNFLAEYFSQLKSGGIIFLEVPCSDWLHKSMDEPHLVFFNKKSMNVLLKRFSGTIVDIGYYGELIEELIQDSLSRKIFRKLLNLILRFRIFFLASLFIKDLDYLSSDIQRIMVFPYKPHIRSQKPAWWIRSVIKANN